MPVDVQPEPAMSSTIRTTTLPSGETIQVLGQGTWKMGEESVAVPARSAL